MSSRDPGVGPALSIRGLSKSYLVGHLRRTRRTAVQDLDLQVERGEILGFLGPNGAGKTTTIKVIVGLAHADSGEITVLGEPHSATAWRHRVGYVPENPYLYDYLTPAEYLDYAGRLFGIPPGVRRQRSHALVERFGLGHVEHLALRRFSKGMIQRVALAQALVNDPELVILDEPMSGLDPLGRRLVRDAILQLKSEGRTVLLSTHILPDAESICDRVALLREGKLVGAGRLDALLTLDEHRLEMTIGALPEAALAALKPLLHSAYPVGERWRFEVDETRLADVVREVAAAGSRVLSVQPMRQSLEDYFVEHTTGQGDRRQGWAD